MTFQQHVELSRKTKGVPPDKFDKHMKKARKDDLTARKSIFQRQSEDSIETQEKRRHIEPSLY